MSRRRNAAFTAVDQWERPRVAGAKLATHPVLDLDVGSQVCGQAVLPVDGADAGPRDAAGAVCNGAGHMKRQNFK